MIKSIKGYEGLYEVSDDGRVFSCERKVKGGHNNLRLVRRKELKSYQTGTGYLERKGYLTVDLHKNNKGKQFYVHILVAEAFISNSNNLPEVNHKDGVKTNNNDWNLEWITNSGNQKHAYKIGLQKRKLGEDHPMVKLTEQQILEIRKSNLAQKELAKEYNVDPTNISCIKRRISWTHI